MGGGEGRGGIGRVGGELGEGRRETEGRRGGGGKSGRGRVGGERGEGRGGKGGRGASGGEGWYWWDGQEEGGERGEGRIYYIFPDWKLLIIQTSSLIWHCGPVYPSPSIHHTPHSVS